MSKRGRPRKGEGAVYQRDDSQFWQVWYRDRKGEIQRESTGTTDREEAERFLRDRLDARDEGRLSTVLISKQLTFGQWADWFLERRSKPPFRSDGNHQQNLNAMKFVRPVFGDAALSDITAERIEDYLAERLRSGRRVRTKRGLELRGTLKPATVHQEFRILSHMLNVAVKQKRLSDNPCRAVEFPVSVAKSTRKPHYMAASEQMKIEFAAPNYLRNVVVILSEMGLRYKKELLPMKKAQVDLENAIVHIADSKTANGIGDMPMTPLAHEAFQRQIEETPGSEYLFPSPKSTASKPHITNVRKGWAATLKKAGVPYFALYELRHTFATRLSAGGVADHVVTQMLRQGDAEVFKLYSQAKLGMMREALTKLDRKANERAGNFFTEKAS
ncbi:MAG TPA: tyrosine-type recombinase/integrase [Bryobacteraceae bacterium]|jgi:integrase|nr:tyrosine-type recombinase/integrase [Bryobacteraceae bacterium]